MYYTFSWTKKVNLDQKEIEQKLKSAINYFELSKKYSIKKLLNLISQTDNLGKLIKVLSKDMIKFSSEEQQSFVRLIISAWYNIPRTNLMGRSLIEQTLLATINSKKEIKNTPTQKKEPNTASLLHGNHFTMTLEAKNKQKEPTQPKIGLNRLFEYDIENLNDIDKNILPNIQELGNKKKPTNKKKNTDIYLKLEGEADLLSFLFPIGSPPNSFSLDDLSNIQLPGYNSIPGDLDNDLAANLFDSFDDQESAIQKLGIDFCLSIYDFLELNKINYSVVKPILIQTNQLLSKFSSNNFENIFNEDEELILESLGKIFTNLDQIAKKLR